MITFAGVIGAGKTTYSKRLAESLGTKIFYESVDDNPILEKYYDDPKKYAFALQIHFLNRRFRSIKEALCDDDNVLDRSIYEDKVFTWINVQNGNISMEEWNIYTELLDNMMEELEGLPKKAPDLLVYLDISFENELKNIKKRGRSYEQIENDPSLYDYYRQLYDIYKDWIEDYDASAKLVINVDDYDIEKDEDWDEVFGLIKNKLDEVRSV